MISPLFIFGFDKRSVKYFILFNYSMHIPIFLYPVVIIDLQFIKSIHKSSNESILTNPSQNTLIK